MKMRTKMRKKNCLKMKKMVIAPRSPSPN